MGHKQTKHRVSLFASAAMAMMALTPQAIAQTAQRTIEMPAQELGAALNQLAAEHDVQIVFRSGLVRGKRAPSLSGALSIEEALRRLLSGSGLTYRRSGEGAYTIVQASRAQAPSQGDGEQSQEEEIVVTGTHIRGASNPTTPVLTFDRESIELSGAPTLQDFVRTIPQNFGGDASAIGLQSDNPFDETGNVRAASSIDLRGLGAGATLTLLNGRRLTAGDGGRYFDVSLLPLSSIDRVDIMTDGASAVYGSDAIGGVVNILTRSNFEGVEFRARVGGVTDGDKVDHEVAANAGASWTGGGLFASGSYVHADALMVTDRDYVTPNVLFPNASLLPEETNHSLYVHFNQDLSQNVSLLVDGLFVRRETAGQSVLDDLLVETEANAYFLNGQLDVDLGPNWSSTFFLDYGRNNAQTEQTVGTDVTPTEDENETLVAEMQASGTLLTMPAGPLRVAFGGLYREESFAAPDPDPLRAVSAEREVTALYAEALVPILATLDLSLAGRFEDYSDFGEAFTPKIGLSWEITEGLLARSTYSESFRAPPLLQVHAPRNYDVRALTGDPLFNSASQDPRLPAGASYTFSITGGNPDLHEETATAWTYGVVWDPPALSGLHAELTAFDISYTDRIENLSPFSVVRQSEFSTFLDRTPDVAYIQNILDHRTEVLFRNYTTIADGDLAGADVQLVSNAGYRNVAALDVRGLDFGVSYDFEALSGDMIAEFNGTYLFEYSVQGSAASPSVDVVNQVYRPVDLRLRGALSWRREAFTAYAAVNYTDTYIDNRYDVGASIDAWTTIDAAIAYDTGFAHADGFRVALTVQNILDEDPPFVDSSDGLFFDSANANPLGRYVAIQLTKTF